MATAMACAPATSVPWSSILSSTTSWCSTRCALTYVPPSARERSNPLTAGGTFEIAAVFTTAGAQHICHVGFQVTTLRGEGGGSPTLLTRRGALIGGEGVIVPARIADGKANLRADRHDQDRFTIGLTQKEPVTFLVNVVGEAGTDAGSSSAAPGTRVLARRYTRQ